MLICVNVSTNLSNLNKESRGTLQKCAFFYDSRHPSDIKILVFQKKLIKKHDYSIINRKFEKNMIKLKKTYYDNRRRFLLGIWFLLIPKYQVMEK